MYPAFTATEPADSLTPQPQSAVEAAISDQQTQILKTAELVHALVNRLEPVTRNFGAKNIRENEVAGTQPADAQSRLLMFIQDNTDSIKQCQAELAQLLNDLDI